jgi:hypothetical protein
MRRNDIDSGLILNELVGDRDDAFVLHFRSVSCLCLCLLCTVIRFV